MGYGLYTMGLFFDEQIARYQARLIPNFSLSIQAGNYLRIATPASQDRDCMLFSKAVKVKTSLNLIFSFYISKRVKNQEKQGAMNSLVLL